MRLASVPGKWCARRGYVRILRCMTDEAAPRVDQEMADQVGFFTHHYMAAVAEYLITQGIPVSSVMAHQPHTAGAGDGARFWEVEGDIDFSPTFARALGGTGGGGASVHWNGVCGWCVSREIVVPGEPTRDEDRWLGAGLVPAPDRVLGLILAAQVDFASAGSDERPHYRAEASDYEKLSARLMEYVPDSDKAFRAYEDPDWRLAQVRDQIYRRRAVTELLTDRSDPVIELPVRRSELRALGHMLEQLEMVSCSTLVAALGRDLAARAQDGPGSAERHRAALGEAHVLNAGGDGAT